MALPAYQLPASTAWTLVYTVPDGQRAAFNVNCAGLASCRVKIAITPGIAPTDIHCLETGTVMALGTVLERTGIVLPAAHRVYVQADQASAVAVQITGIEETV